jgi:hypothetical protein
MSALVFTLPGIEPADAAPRAYLIGDGSVSTRNQTPTASGTPRTGGWSAAPALRTLPFNAAMSAYWYARGM